MGLQIIEDVPQGSAEWHALHVGIVTASCFSRALAGGDGKVRGKYMREKAGEIICGVPAESYRNGAMDRGNAMEEELRTLYALQENVDVRQVGFGVNDGLLKGRRIGGSPDGLVDPGGGVEIKTENPAALIVRHEAGPRIPAEHMAQVQGLMWVFEREWWDVRIGYGKMPMFKCRVRRDENLIARIRVGLEVFHEELDKLVERVRRFG